MGRVPDRLLAPTAELLLDVRTPAELTFSPDGSEIAFASHATVADVGSFVPSDLFVVKVEGEGRTRQLTSGSWSDRTPAWSHDGSRLAFLSDRITPGHHLPYTMPADGGEPDLAATLVGSAESVAWSGDDSRLLVLAADPGSYGLDWSARAVNGATPLPDPVVRRPGGSRRRLFLIDRGSGDVVEVGPPDLSVWEVDWDGDATAVAIVSHDHSGSGWYQGVLARLDLHSRTARTIYEPSWQMEGVALAPDASRVAVIEGYASDHGLLSGSVMVIDLATGVPTDPWPDLQTVGRRLLV
jgi:dipeptidyl aminopeptidase/acylaminoacyl peptidase